MPPSLRVSVGVPPVTVTNSLRVSVKVTVLPASRSPLAGDAISEVAVAVAICCGLGAALTSTTPLASGIVPFTKASPAVSSITAPLPLNAIAVRSELVSPVTTVYANASELVPEPPV